LLKNNNLNTLSNSHISYTSSPFWQKISGSLNDYLIAKKRAIIRAIFKLEVIMQTLLTDLAISMSEFKKNPAKALREAGAQPVAVLSHNKPAFYMVAPKMFEAMLENLADAQIVPLLKQRLAQRSKAIEVDPDEI
jgi:antitoxin StbD